MSQRHACGASGYVTLERDRGGPGCHSHTWCLPLPVDMEKGCHLLHILNCVHLNLRWDLSKAVLQRVLELLEDQSDIVSTADHYYAAF